MHLRLAHPSEMDDIYMMGYDAWGEGEPEDEYLSLCRGSTKYARGRWYVLADDHGRPVASLITYDFGPGVFGLGSIATPPALRRQGLAARLIEGVLGAMKLDEAKAVFLYSDIGSHYYERFGFRPLPEQFQKKTGSICMAWGASVEELIHRPNFAPPAYF